MAENVSSALERAAAIFPQRLAVVDGELKWSYSELRQRVAGFDTALDQLHLDVGDAVAVLSGNSAAHLVAWLAVPRSGRVLADLDPRSSPTELARMLDDCGARALIVDDLHTDTGRHLADRCPAISYLIYAGSGSTPEGMLSLVEMMDRPALAPVPVEDDLPAAIAYTAGVIGPPKGVLLTQRNLVTGAKHAAIAFGYDSRDSHLYAIPMFSSTELTTCIALTWVGGSHVVMPDFDASTWLHHIAEHPITRAHLLSPMVEGVLGSPDVNRLSRSTLRTLHYSGGRLPVDLLCSAAADLPHFWTQGYVLTEAAGPVLLLTAEDHRRGMAGEDPYWTRLQSAGRPVLGTDVEVRHRDGVRAGVGDVGEVWIRGPNVATTYCKRTFTTESCRDGLGWQRTGDIGYVDSGGYFFVVDRVLPAVLINGREIHPALLEQSIGSHPDIADCAVYQTGGSAPGRRLHVVVVHAGTGDIDEAAFAHHCQQIVDDDRLGVDLHVRRKPLPRSASGHILRYALAQEYSE